MQFLKTRSEVKFKVTVTQLWYATLPHLKIHPHTTKFEIPTSNNIRDAPDTIILKTRSEVKVKDRHSDPKMVRDTPPSQDASTYQIRNSYLVEYRRYAQDTKLTDGHCDYYKNLVRCQGQGHSDLKMVRNTLPSQDASTHQIWNSYVK